MTSGNTKHRGWIASLSTGETVFEHPTSRGELSAWQHLLARCQAENTRITQLRLQRGGVTVVAMPMADGYMQAYQDRISLNTHNRTTVQGIGSVDAKRGLIFITWVNDQGHVWQDIQPLGTMYVHSTLREGQL